MNSFQASQFVSKIIDILTYKHILHSQIEPRMEGKNVNFPSFFPLASPYAENIFENIF